MPIRISLLALAVAVALAVPAAANHSSVPCPFGAGGCYPHLERNGNHVAVAVDSGFSVPAERALLTEALEAWNQPDDRVKLWQSSNLFDSSWSSCSMPTSDSHVKLCVGNYGANPSWGGPSLGSKMMREDMNSDPHYTRGRLRLNTFYSTGDDWIRWGICHLLGHTLGIESQSDTAAHPTSCMGHDGPPDVSPDDHDLAVATSLYDHGH